MLRGPRNPARRLVAWLRVGHPKGLVQHDYIALFGVLHRDLTTEEVDDIARSLYQMTGESGPTITRDHIRAAIEREIHERPRERDVKRILARLAAEGRAESSRVAPQPEG